MAYLQRHQNPVTPRRIPIDLGCARPRFCGEIQLESVAHSPVVPVVMSPFNPSRIPAPGAISHLRATNGKAAVEEIQSTTKREGDERIARLMAEAESRFQTELARVTHGLDQIKAEADARIQQIKSKAEARVTAAETGANKRIDMISTKNEDQIVRLEADLADATQRADRAEQWLLIRREIEDHLMPSFTAIHNLMRPEGTDRGDDERGEKSLFQAQP
jgi:hypothetical protein